MNSGNLTLNLSRSESDLREGQSGLAGGRRVHRWAVLAVLCVTLLLISVDNTILNVALPSIVRGLGANSTQLQWIADVYAVVFAGFLLSLGALGDRLGRKWVFQCGLITFAGGSAMAAWSGSPDRLMVARGLMGIGAAALMPCTLSILTNVFTGARDRARAIGVWSGTTGIGVAVGPILGGFLLAHYWWGSVFLVNVPIALGGLVAAALVVPNSQNPRAERPGSHGCPAIDRRPGSVAVGHHRGTQSRLDLSGDRGRTGRGHPRYRRLCLVGAPQRPSHAALAVLCQPTI